MKVARWILDPTSVSLARSVSGLVVVSLLLSGCGDDGGGGGKEGVIAPIDVGDDGTDDAGLDVGPDDAGEDASDDVPSDATGQDVDEDVDADVGQDTNNCPLGHPCNPIPVGQTPWTDARDTTTSTSSVWDSYGCAPATDESGPEWVYRFDAPMDGTLTVGVNDVSGDGVDIDVHILGSADPDDCLARDNRSASARVVAGQRYILVADTWVDGGMEYSGAYDLTVSFTPALTGNCAMDTIDLKMFWSSCGPGIDCYEAVDPDDGNTYRWLRTPATGPVVKEAHLVTVDDGFGAGWPTSFTDGIDNHYALSQAATGYVMDRTEPWAPAGEGGSEFGQGSTGAKLPVIEEAFYINMYWRERPARGTRMIVMNPENGRAVVAAAGYETGPGANTAIAGVTEEIHDHLGTGHRDTLMVGFATDQSLEYGPIDCD